MVRASLSALASGAEVSASTGTARPSLLAISGFVTGVLILVASFAEFLTPTPPSPTQLDWMASQNYLARLAFRSFAWGLFAVAAIPFYAVLGRLFRPRNAEGALAATLLSAVGVTLFVLRAILQDSGVAAAGTLGAPSTTEAAYQANLLSDAANPLLPLGGAIWGLGFILFGVLAWNSGILSNRLAIVAFVGGAAGWAIFPILNAFGDFLGYAFTEILVPLATAVWGLSCGAIFLGRARSLLPIGVALVVAGGALFAVGLLVPIGITGPFVVFVGALVTWIGRKSNTHGAGNPASPA